MKNLIRNLFLLVIALLLSSVNGICQQQVQNNIAVSELNVTSLLELIRDSKETPAHRVFVEATVNSVDHIRKIHLYLGSKRDVTDLYQCLFFVTQKMGKTCVVSPDNKSTEVINNTTLRFDFPLDEHRFSSYKSMKLVFEDDKGILSEPAYFDRN